MTLKQRITQRKTHLFTDCSNFNWQMPDNERVEQTSANVNDCTCGACKGRVLQLIRETDWSSLNPTTLDLLTRLADHVRQTSEHTGKRGRIIDNM